MPFSSGKAFKTYINHHNIAEWKHASYNPSNKDFSSIYGTKKIRCKFPVRAIKGLHEIHFQEHLEEIYRRWWLWTSSGTNRCFQQYFYLQWTKPGRVFFNLLKNCHDALNDSIAGNRPEVTQFRSIRSLKDWSNDSSINSSKLFARPEEILDGIRKIFTINGPSHLKELSCISITPSVLSAFIPLKLVFLSSLVIGETIWSQEASSSWKLHLDCRR